MLAESKIDFLETRLEQFRLNDQARQNDLQQLLKEHDQLLKDYRALRKTHDQKRNGSVGTGKESSPYILLLVDGNKYIFNDELIKDKEEGGMRAARLLNEVIEKYVQQNLPKNRSSRVIINVFADYTRLSKQLAQSKLVGFDKRSIAPFAAGFTRTFGFTSFVDTLDEEGTKIKIREQFRAAANDSTCSHILFAACHDPAYKSCLIPYTGVQEKVTLVQGADWKPEFHQFNLNVTQFPSVFRWSELPASALSTKATTPTTTGQRTPSENSKVSQVTYRNISQIDNWRDDTAALIKVDDPPRPPSSLAPSDTATLDRSKLIKDQYCRFFRKGYCSYGSKCKFQHGPDDMRTLPAANSTTVSGQLPSATIPGFIPLNKNDQRLDTYIRPPTGEEWKIYNDRFYKQKPCNDYHLQRSCTQLDCPYDHNELEAEARHVLEYVLRSNSCPRRSACREADCYYGHICQKDGCTGHGKGCKLSRAMHQVDPVMVGSAPAVDELVQGMTAELPANSAPTAPLPKDFLW